MGTQGVFGYIIGRKKRLMHVHSDADILWQVLVREIYVLMKHYGTKELLQNAFEKIKIAKNKPSVSDIEKCKFFTDFENVINTEDWYTILRFCQISFINILEVGYILNEKTESGYVFILDFNKEEVIHYFKDLEGNTKQLDKARLKEIMEFDEMPKKSYTEIVSEMKDQFNIYYENLTKLRNNIKKVKQLFKEARQQGAINIEEKLQKMLYDYEFEEKILHRSRRVFYHRLKSLDLIDEE